MEVSGKRANDENSGVEHVNCEPCNEEDKQTAAVGFCKECEQYMCTKCFRDHCKGKLCKDHKLELVYIEGVCEESRPNHSNDEKGPETCVYHAGEPIKFYCPAHVHVGCGDCMIFEHKTCNVEYIRDKTTAFKESKEFEDFFKHLGARLADVEQFESNIKKAISNIDDSEASFRNGVETFRDELIEHITKLTDGILEKGNSFFHETKTNLRSLEREYNGLAKEISTMNQTIESSFNFPHKLFINTIKLKSRLMEIDDQFLREKEQRTTGHFEFQRDRTLSLALAECKVLGTIQTVGDGKDKEGMPLHPRLCHFIKRPDFPGFGFNLRFQVKEINYHYVGKVDENSPAEKSGLRVGDKLVEVNYENMENKTHEEVVAKIKAGSDEMMMLVVDKDTDAYYKSLGKVVQSSLPEVVYLKASVKR